MLTIESPIFPAEWCSVTVATPSGISIWIV